MKKIIMCLMILLLSGCNDYVEINDLLIASGIIIDYKDNKYELISELVNDTDKTYIYKTKCSNVEECISELSKISNKKVFISHLKGLFLSDNLIKEDNKFYDYFLRNSKSKMNFYVYLIDDNITNKLFQSKDESVSLYIKNMLELNTQVYSSSTELTFINYIYKKNEPGINPVFPKIKLDEDNNVIIEDIVSYNYKNKPVKLDDNESIIFNLVTNKLKNTSIDIKCEDDDFSIFVQDSDVDYKWKNNTFYINANVDAKINSYNCKYNLSKNESIKMLNKLSSNYFNEEIDKLIKVMKDNNNDFIGIGNYIYKHDNKFFNFDKYVWDKKIKDIKFNVKSEVQINSIGEMRK